MFKLFCFSEMLNFEQMKVHHIFLTCLYLNERKKAIAEQSSKNTHISNEKFQKHTLGLFNEAARISTR